MKIFILIAIINKIIIIINNNNNNKSLEILILIRF